jgi:hypothetical protein
VFVGAFKVLHGFARLLTRTATPRLSFSPICPEIKEHNCSLSAGEKSELIGVLFL